MYQVSGVYYGPRCGALLAQCQARGRPTGRARVAWAALLVLAGFGTRLLAGLGEAAEPAAQRLLERDPWQRAAGAVNALERVSRGWSFGAQFAWAALAILPACLAVLAAATAALLLALLFAWLGRLAEERWEWKVKEAWRRRVAK